MTEIFGSQDQRIVDESTLEIGAGKELRSGEIEVVRSTIEKEKENPLFPALRAVKDVSGLPGGVRVSVTPPFEPKFTDLGDLHFVACNLFPPDTGQGVVSN